MNCAEFQDLFRRSGKRCMLLGDENFGVFSAPDMEARLFLVYRGALLSRVNPAAILGYSDGKTYLNPGGDGLWPAPEGSRYGYNYAAVNWSVSTGLLRARFDVELTQGKMVLVGDVPLVNASGTGLQTRFFREITIPAPDEALIVDTIRYLGPVTREKGSVRLAAWSLSQFDRTAGDCCTFDGGTLRDLYTDSSRFRQGNRCFPTDEIRYQVAAGNSCRGISLFLSERGLSVSREVVETGKGNDMDIADLPPTENLTEQGVRYSFYSDPSAFTEIETAGFGTDTLSPGDEVKLTTRNRVGAAK